MTTDERTAKMNQIVVDRADHAYVLADSSKFNRASFATTPAWTRWRRCSPTRAVGGAAGGLRRGGGPHPGGRPEAGEKGRGEESE